MEELFLKAVLTRQKLNVVNQQNVHVAVLITKLHGRSVLERLDVACSAGFQTRHS